MSEQTEATAVDLTDNPLLCMEGLPKFDQIQAEHVVPAVKKLLADAELALSSLEESVEPTWNGCFAKLEEIDRPFEYGWGPVSHLFGVKNSPELREAYEAVLDDVVQFGLRASQSRPIYEACVAIRNGSEWSNLSPARQRIVEKKIQSAELSGIGLAGAQQKRFNEIAQELSQLSTTFSNNVLDATKAFELVLTEQAEVDGLPESALAMAAQSFTQKQAERVSDDGAADRDSAGEAVAALEATAEAGPWRFTLDGPSFLPFMQHCRRSDLREKLYRAFITRASEGEFNNEQNINRILTLRQQKAELLGFQTFAEMSLATKMAPSSTAVEEMFETLRSASWDAAVVDMDEVRQLARAEGFAGELKHWDVGFWAERLRERKFDYTDEELRPYFPLEKTLSGMFDLVERLFGITVRQADLAPVWHADVRYFEVLDSDGSNIAAFYLDPYSRPENKRGGAWMDDCLGRKVINGRTQLPVAHLVCNSTPPVGSKPSLMTFREVETLFHEFGHGLQHMLTTINEADAAGISGVEWDAVELPSQFMENWCYHRPTVASISGHYATGESLPDELFEKLKASRTFRAGSTMLRQLTFGMTDMLLHGGFKAPQDGDNSAETAFDVQRQVVEKTSILPMLEEDRMLCSFSHIFAGGYAAGYYSYKWAEVLSADAFSAFEDAGLDDEDAVAEVGRRFRNTILSLGGSQHPMDIYRAFRGREPDPAPLLRHSGLA
ncbi:MAG: M3 family metallopeptidase [Planctomycetota bacterium]|nr:M3 family metallopeptidase [Planctomycetota bacterium]